MREGKSTRAREEVSLRDAPAFKKINMEIKTKQMYQSILSVSFFSYLLHIVIMRKIICSACCEL